MKVRKALEKDLDSLERLLYQVHAIHTEKRSDIFKPGKKKYTREELVSLLNDENNPIYVAVDDKDEVLGYAFLQFQHKKEDNNTYARDTLYIDDLCVDENFRGKGIGKFLYEAVKEIAKQKSVDAITLHVWNSNESALKFYSELGMEPLYTTMEEKLK